MLEPSFRNTILALYFFTLSIFSNEKENLAHISKLSQVLDTSSNYELFLAENFANSYDWQIVASASFINRLNVTKKFPDIPSYEKESKSFQFSYLKKSLMLHTFFENPSRNAFYIRPRAKIKLKLGLPVQVIFWIYSNNYDVKMHLVLSQKAQPDIKIKLGDLKFQGWKRLQKSIHVPERNYHSNLVSKNPFYLDRVYFHPTRRQKKGDFIVYLGRMLFLTDKTQMNQVNIQIRDNW